MKPVTPLEPLVRLGRQLDLELFSKVELCPPTWSYKDRLARFAASHAESVGASVVVVASSGNHGAAVAAACARRGLVCLVICSPDVTPTMRRLIRGAGGVVASVANSSARWDLMRRAVRRLGWYPASNFHDPAIGSNPFAVDGYRVIAAEIVEQLGSAPDWVVVPVGYGDGIAGIGRGFQDVHATRATSRPKLLAAETTGSLATALDRGLDQPPPRPTLAPEARSINVSRGTYQALEAIRSSGGAALMVDGEQAAAAVAALSSHEGSYQELSSACGFAALRHARAVGLIPRRSRVVLVATSVGLKDGGEQPEATATGRIVSGLRELQELVEVERPGPAMGSRRHR